MSDELDLHEVDPFDAQVENDLIDAKTKRRGGPADRRQINPSLLRRIKAWLRPRWHARWYYELEALLTGHKRSLDAQLAKYDAYSEFIERSGKDRRKS